jgi:cobalt-zinc-cadmium efflux system outer membrane protein
MSSSFNQRSNTHRSYALKPTAYAFSSKCSVLLLTLAMVISNQSVQAESLLDANQSPNRAMQRNASFDQILEQIRSYQANQSSWQTQQQMASAQLKQSALWANPSISVEQTGFQSNKDQELAIGVSQPLDLFGQRRAAQKVAQLSATQVDLEQQRYNAELDLIVQYGKWRYSN